MSSSIETRSELARSTTAHPTGQPIDTRSLSERVYDYLTDQIIEGAIRYGQKLSIKELAQRLNVSTMPVREAVKRLETEGVIVVKPRSNCEVANPTRTSMLEAFELRTVLETYAIEKIYDSVKEEELREMGEYLSRMEETGSISSQGEMQQFTRFDQLFHQELCVLVNNSFILKTYRQNMLHLTIALTFQAGVAPNMDQIRADHREIYEGLLRNSYTAVETLKRHLEQCRVNMVNGKTYQNMS